MKIRDKKGFTLAETLLTVVLVLLVSGAVAAGISVVSRTIHKIQNKANAEVLLNTTLTLLSEDLKNTKAVVMTEDESEVGYFRIRENGADVWIGVKNGGSTAAGQKTDNTGIQKIYYTETVSTDGESAFAETGISAAYVTGKAKTDTLYTTIGSITYDKPVLTIHDLEVKNSDDVTLAKIDSFSVAAQK